MLKVHSRCDLACDHCYVYEHADQSWRTRPRMMSPETVRAAALRIAEHAGAHRLPRVRVILHGGEPLLLGPRRLRATLDELRSTIAPVTRLDLRMQTNGVLLSPQLCDLLTEYPVRVGVSLDGDRVANDRHRRFAAGQSSYDAVLRALALLRRPGYRRSYAGILCTVDVRNDPIRVYEALLAQEPPRIDFLLPHATWDNPPHRPPGLATPYADWLRRIFVRWLADGRPVSVRLFDSLLSAGTGGPSGTEAVGLDPADLAVIETDGTWEQVDSLKTSYDGAAATGLDVFTHPVDVVADHPGVAARHGGRESLCRTCRECPVVDRCGGGLFPHRYRDGYGFDNPSVYCADLKEFITTMDEHLIGTTPAADRAGDGAGRSAQDALLDQIGSGYGDDAAIALLAESQLSITRALLVAVRDAAPATGPAARLIADAWDLLGRLDDEAPAAVAAVLAHPFVRAWAVRCLGGPAPEAEGAALPDVAYLGCLAAAAAIRAGQAAEVIVPVHGRQVYLPTLGRFRLPAPAGPVLRLTIGPDSSVLRSADGNPLRDAGGRPLLGPGAGTPDAGETGLELGGTELGGPAPGGLELGCTELGGLEPDGADEATGGWQPVRRVDRDGLPLLIEESDPYRSCFGWPIASRLSAAALRAWTWSVAGAWRAIGRDVPDQLPGVRGAQRVLVPLGPTPAGVQRAATARHAFGAVGVSPVAEADELAVLLVHELQHAKLNALLDLYDLVDATYPHRMRVPWRPDPRPIEGVLHGTYAHLAIADVWRARAAAGQAAGGPVAGDRAAGGPVAGDRAATGHYRRYRDWTLAAIDDLCATGALTPAGERFVAQMRQTAGGWPATGGART